MYKEHFMKSAAKPIRNENGSVLVVALIVLVLLTIIGISGINTFITEMQSATNHEFYKTAFYAAEAARPYVMEHPKLYGADNVTPGDLHYFPIASGDYVQVAAEPDGYTLSTTQSFTGSVEYAGSSDPPRGSGFEEGEFKAHQYQMICTGYGPRNTTKQIRSGFYRIGF